MVKVVSKSKQVQVQTVGKCLTQWQVTLGFDSPVDQTPYTELTQVVRSFLPCYPEISSLRVNQVDPYLASVVYVVDSSD